jgi:hypothetical protein
MVLALSAQQISSISWAASLSAKAERQLRDIFFAILKKRFQKILDTTMKFAQQKLFERMLNVPLNVINARAANAAEMILAS